MKVLTLTAALTVLCMNLALANDPVAQQVNLTRDAVNVALEEFSQGLGDASLSADSQTKIAKFNRAASAALVKFEESVRQQILEPMGVLIGKYNKTLVNPALGPARDEIIMGLREQLKVIQRNKSMAYRQIFRQLYSVLPDLPVSMESWIESIDLDGDTRVPWKYVESTQQYGCSLGTVNADVYMAKSGERSVALSAKRCGWFFRFDDLLDLVKQTLPGRESSRRSLLADCFSSSCLYATQARYFVWKAMVEDTLVPDLLFRMDDGFSVVISRKAPQRIKEADLLIDALSSVDSAGFLNKLFLEISEERAGLLSQADSQLAQNSCRAAKRLTDRLCQETREGCITAAEVALLKDRHARTASCL